MKFYLYQIVCTIAFIVFSNTAFAVNFTPLGDLAGGSFTSSATDVSSDGSVVAGTGRSTNGVEAFRWTSAGGMEGLGSTSSLFFLSEAKAISSDGSVVVGFSPTTNSGGFNEAFRWTSATGIESLGVLGIVPGTPSISFAHDVSRFGSVIVGESTNANGNNEAFRWTSTSGMEGMGFLSDDGFPGSEARGISDDGSVIVGDSTNANGNSEAFRWTSATGMESIGDLAGGIVSASALDVSADGSVVVGISRSDFGLEAFRWTSADGMMGLGDLAGDIFDSRALGVSADGSVIVGTGNGLDDGDAFRWTSDGGMQSVASMLTASGINLTGWQLTDAQAVSYDGNIIVGSGINPDGIREAWIADVTVVPVPAAIWLFGSGLIGFLSITRRKR